MFQVSALINRATTFRKIKKVDLAIEDLELIKEVDNSKNGSGGAHFWEILGSAYADGDYFDEALQAFGRAIEIDPANCELNSLNMLYRFNRSLYLYVFLN